MKESIGNKLLQDPHKVACLERAAAVVLPLTPFQFFFSLCIKIVLKCKQSRSLIATKIKFDFGCFGGASLSSSI